jgi:hypothetical protein
LLSGSSAQHLRYIYLPFNREYIRAMTGSLISSMMLATDRVCPKERQAELVDVELARNFVHLNSRNLSTLYII